MMLLQAFEGQGVKCGSLNATSSNNLLGSGTIKRYSSSLVNIPDELLHKSIVPNVHSY